MIQAFIFASPTDLGFLKNSLPPLLKMCHEGGARIALIADYKKLMLEKVSELDAGSDAENKPDERHELLPVVLGTQPVDDLRVDEESES